VEGKRVKRYNNQGCQGKPASASINAGMLPNICNSTAAAAS
jgi:hypothetical protein